MEKYRSKCFEEMDVTRSEMDSLKEAFKKEKFVSLFKDYLDDINDPENKALYEKELTALEKERGVDITFIHPSPGYVLKTSVEGSDKAYVNICYNEKIDPPKSQHGVQNGHEGNNWSLPYIRSQGRPEMNRKGKQYVVFDVIFNPLALDLAHRSPEFKEMVNDTALSAIESEDSVKLDRKNIRLAKTKFKGCKTACVLRRKSDTRDSNVDCELMNIPNYPYPPLEEDVAPKKVTPTSSEGLAEYTVPKYVIKHHKRVELQEYTNAPDSKFHAAIPAELRIEVDLPLIKSATDVNLDVVSKSLALVSEKPAKYKLELALPYEVDDDHGSAKFDKTTKKLYINLPVKKKRFHLSDSFREDSGIESDVTHANRSSSEEDVSKDIERLSMDEGVCSISSEDSNGTFLDPDRHYTFPEFTLSRRRSTLTLTVPVKNVDPSSVSHLDLSNGFHLKFTSVGSGRFPLYYSLCFQVSSGNVDSDTLAVEVWDNSVVVDVHLDARYENCLIGLDPVHMEERKLPVIESLVDEDGDDESDALITTAISEESIKDSTTCLVDESKGNPQHESVKSDATESHSKIKKTGTCKKDSQHQKDYKVKFSPKTRTYSESTSDPCPIAARSILKCSRSLSEDNCCLKKTVRFNDNVLKKVFRANSSILGQKRKNERKARNRKRAQERRASESEAETEEGESMSEVSSMSDVSDTSSDDGSAPPPQPGVGGAKSHRRRGVKNRRKNAASAKQNFLLDRDSS